MNFSLKFRDYNCVTTNGKFRFGSYFLEQLKCKEGRLLGDRITLNSVITVKCIRQSLYNEEMYC